MPNPVILIGIDRDDYALSIVGLYESQELANEAVQSGGLPSAFYSVITPEMNTCMQARKQQALDKKG